MSVLLDERADLFDIVEGGIPDRHQSNSPFFTPRTKAAHPAAVKPDVRQFKSSRMRSLPLGPSQLFDHCSQRCAGLGGAESEVAVDLSRRERAPVPSRLSGNQG